MKPIFIPQYINQYLSGNDHSAPYMESVKKAYQTALLKGAPEISIVIPAYNEEENIVPTLASLCNNKTGRSVEIIVVNNVVAANLGVDLRELFQGINGGFDEERHEA